MGSSAKTPKNVAHHATKTDVLPHSGPVVIGIFGATNTPEALIRLPSGRVRRVKTGTRLAMGEIVAIDSKGLLVQRNGQSRRLEIPGG